MEAVCRNYWQDFCFAHSQLAPDFMRKGAAVRVEAAVDAVIQAAIIRVVAVFAVAVLPGAATATVAVTRGGVIAVAAM